MRTKYWIRPYARDAIIREIVERLDGRFLLPVGTRYVYQRGDVFINWGCYAPLPVPVGRCLNPPNAVKVAGSKLKTFAVCKEAGIPIPEYTKDRNVAKLWQKKGFKVLGRDQDRGMRGAGITVYQPDQEIGNHLFYVRYFKKERELRLHVFNGKVIFQQEKLKKNGAVGADKYIRSHDRGWCFGFKHFGEKPVPKGLAELAVSTVLATKLDFGAVDIGWNKRDGAVVFEVNTAPGVENTSLKAYLDAFRNV